MLKHSVLLNLDLDLGPSFWMMFLALEVKLDSLTALMQALELTTVFMVKMLQLDAAQIVREHY